MSAVEDRPTVAERYGNATQSSNLKVSTETTGDADVLIAAGWCSALLGAKLARLRSEFDAVRSDLYAQGNSTPTSRTLALGRMKSLNSTRDMLCELALANALRTHFDRPESEVRKVSAQVLDVFLDPLCGKCFGRGFSGGGRHEQSGPRLRCGTCGETGKRRWRLGRDEAERVFAHGLLGDIEEKAAEFEQQLGRRLRNR